MDVNKVSQSKSRESIPLSILDGRDDNDSGDDHRRIPRQGREAQRPDADARLTLGESKGC